MEYTWLTTQQIADNDRYPFTWAQLRYYMANRDVNGLGMAVRKVGKHLLIREDLFNEWLDSHKETKDG